MVNENSDNKLVPIATTPRPMGFIRPYTDIDQVADGDLVGISAIASQGELATCRGRIITLAMISTQFRYN